MSKDRCFCRNEETKERCPNPYFITIKVQVFHPLILRKTWQNWKLCEPHFSNFKETGGKDWYVWYSKVGKPHCPVIDYYIVE